MKITKLHRDIAEALVTQRATPADIRARFRVGPKALARWETEPAFRALLAEIETRHRRRARWLFVTFAEIAAARLVKLTEADSAETARKACLDVLAKADLSTTANDATEQQPTDTSTIDADTRQRIYELLTAGREPPAKPTPAAETEPPTDAERPTPSSDIAAAAPRGPEPAPRPSIAEPAAVLHPALAAAGQMSLPFVR